MDITCIIHTHTHSHTPHLEYKADIAEPLSVLQRRVPLITDGGETSGLQRVVALSDRMDVGDIEVGQLGLRVARDVLCAFTL